MSLTLMSVKNSKYTFMDGNNNIYTFSWEDVRSIATALLMEYLKMDVSQIVDDLSEDGEINLTKLNGITTEQFKSYIVSTMSDKVVDELAEPDMDRIWDMCMLKAKEYGIA